MVYIADISMYAVMPRTIVKVNAKDLGRKAKDLKYHGYCEGQGQELRSQGLGFWS